MQIFFVKLRNTECTNSVTFKRVVQLLINANEANKCGVICELDYAVDALH